jgi:hypothetical protein
MSLPASAPAAPSPHLLNTTAPPDLRLRFGDGGEDLQAHMRVISLYSNVFASALEADAAGNVNRADSGGFVIDASGDDRAAWASVLSLLYPSTGAAVHVGWVRISPRGARQRRRRDTRAALLCRRRRCRTPPNNS